MTWESKIFMFGIGFRKIFLEILYSWEGKNPQNHSHLPYGNSTFPWEGNVIPKQKDQNTPVATNYHRA